MKRPSHEKADNILNLKLFIPRGVTGTELVPMAWDPASMSPLADPD